MLILLTLIMGCMEYNKQPIQNQLQSHNYPPVPIIGAPSQAYFGEIIEFDASSSYDIDGKIKSYYWDFGDNITSQGIKTLHEYKRYDLFSNLDELFIPFFLNF